MRIASLLFLCLGAAALGGLLFLNDWRAVLSAFATVGWGLAAISLYRFLPILLHALGWWKLMPEIRPNLLRTLEFRWVGESVNTLLPVAQIGGDVVRVRLLAGHGMNGAAAGAGVAVDFLLGIITQALFTLIGVGLLAGAAGGNGGLPAALAGLGFLLLAGAALWWGQKRGMFERLAGFTARLGGEATQGLALKAERLDAGIKELLARREILLPALGWRLAGWVSHVGETWLILYLMGAGPDWSQAFALESLAWAVRSAAFLIPAAIGAQEGGIVAISLALGLPLETGLALALVKRGRELLVCTPGLLVWLWRERRR